MKPVRQHDGRRLTLTRERLLLLTRVYHSAKYAADAIGANPATVEAAAARFGLKFREKGAP